MVQAIGYASSAAFPDPVLANLVSVLASSLVNLFGGFVPDIGKNAFWAYTRWAQRGIIAAELIESGASSVDDYERYLFFKEWTKPDLYADCRNLILIYIGVLLITYVVLLLRHRDKQR